MSTVKIQLTGVAAELVLGNYMPKDATIFNNWEEFYHFNNLIHNSLLLIDHISEIQIKLDGEVIFTGKIPVEHIRPQKSTAPVLDEGTLYLRTECAEQAVYTCEFKTESFDKKNLYFETQDYDLMFKVGNAFLVKMLYEDKELIPEWESGNPLGNICVLCRFDKGYLVPVYDAVNKLTTN